MASLKGHLEVVKYLIKHGADIHAKDKFDKMPFHNACSKGHVEVAEYLISCGTDINTFFKDANELDLILLILEIMLKSISEL